MGRIVVGVDGSEGSLQALRFAAEEARFRNGQLETVAVWEYPAGLYAGEGWAVATTEALDQARVHAERSLAAAVDGLGPALEGVRVEQRVIEGRPAAALLKQAEGADLLVVGSRGHSGFVGLLLGSVSQQCAHHAPCPVVIVPPLRR